MIKPVNGDLIIYLLLNDYDINGTGHVGRVDLAVPLLERAIDPVEVRNEIWQTHFGSFEWICITVITVLKFYIHNFLFQKFVFLSQLWSSSVASANCKRWSLNKFNVVIC